MLALQYFQIFALSNLAAHQLKITFSIQKVIKRSLILCGELGLAYNTIPTRKVRSPTFQKSRGSEPLHF